MGEEGAGGEGVGAVDALAGKDGEGLSGEFLEMEGNRREE